MTEPLYRVRIEIDPDDWLVTDGTDPGHPHVTTQAAVDYYKSIGFRRNARINVTAAVYWFLKGEWPRLIEILGDEPPRPWMVANGK